MIKRPHHLITRFAGHALGDSVRIRWLDLRYEVGSEQRGGWTESGERASTDFPEGTAWQEFKCSTVPIVPGSGGGSEERAISGAGIRIEGARKFYLDCDALQRAVDELTDNREAEFALAGYRREITESSAVWQATLEAMLVIARRVANSPANTALRNAEAEAQAAYDRAQAELDRAQAAYDRAQAELDRAQAERDRILSDPNFDFSDLSDLSDPNSAYTAAAAALGNARNARNAAQADLTAASRALSAASDRAQAAGDAAANANRSAAALANANAALANANAEVVRHVPRTAALRGYAARTNAINAVEFGVDASTPAELNANADVIEVRRLGAQAQTELLATFNLALRGLPQVVDWRYGIMHSELEHDSVIYNAHAVNEYGHYCEIIATRKAE